MQRCARGLVPSSVVAHELTDAEREEGWSRLLAYNPVLSGYQACTKRRIALFALERPNR